MSDARPDEPVGRACPDEPIGLARSTNSVFVFLNPYIL